MEFINFTVTNARGDQMPFCFNEREASAMIEKIINNAYNYGKVSIVIEKL